MDEREVVEGDCLGVSLGEPWAVEGQDSVVVEVTVLFKRVRGGRAVDAIM